MLLVSSSLALVLQLLLLSPRLAVSSNPSRDNRGAANDIETMPVKPLTWPKPTSTAQSTVTDEVTTVTDEVTTVTDEVTTVTDEVTTEHSTAPPLDDLNLYLETREELQLVSTVLENFDNLAKSDADGQPAVSRLQRGYGGRTHPSVWWQRKATLSQQRTYNFCKDPNNELCHELETQFEMIDDLVEDLIVNVDDWQNSDLEQLQQQRKELNNTYKLASDNEDAFNEAVKKDEFLNAIAEVEKHVEVGCNAVQKKINEMDPPANPDSVVLAAVVGSVGCLMMVAIVGVMLYAAVKKPKVKKQPTARKGKVHGENIPIDAFVQDGGPGLPSTSRMDPYSHAPVPAAPVHNYSDLGARREPIYPESMDGRSQQGLRRTNF